MDVMLMKALTQAGAFSAVSLAAVGSALGCGAAGAAAVGAWKKCYAQNKPAPFQLMVFAGAALTQTIYGMIVMFFINGRVADSYTAWPLFLLMGILGGIAMGMSAWMQGKAAAGACDAQADTGKGFTNYLLVLGIIETVAIFVMVFVMILLASVTKVDSSAVDSAAAKGATAVEQTTK
jgi:V/A-type H+-transporting ATPase subunit K